jgi:hypothetical protein
MPMPMQQQLKIIKVFCRECETYLIGATEGSLTYCGSCDTWTRAENIKRDDENNLTGDDVMSNPVMDKPAVFKESDFKNQVTQLRIAVEAALAEGMSKVNSGEISETEYQRTKAELIDKANRQRGEVIRSRAAAVDEQLLAYSRRLAGIQHDNQETLTSFRKNYEDLLEAGTKDKNKIISSYKTSLRLGDETNLRAAALVGHELGIAEIINDFGNRDPDFLATAQEAAAFKKRYTDVESRFYDMLGDFRTIDAPKEKRVPVMTGYILDKETGYRIPQYRDKLKRG